jgi:hypothetical protein
MKATACAGPLLLVIAAILVRADNLLVGTPTPNALKGLYVTQSPH